MLLVMVLAVAGEADAAMPLTRKVVLAALLGCAATSIGPAASVDGIDGAQSRMQSPAGVDILVVLAACCVSADASALAEALVGLHAPHFSPVN